jgi:hypothetical protein
MFTVEEHGSGRQLARAKMWPRFSRTAITIASLTVLMTLFAIRSDQPIAAVLLAGIFAAIVMRMVQDRASTMHDVGKHLRALARPPGSDAQLQQTATQAAKSELN